ncbi:MAG: hypothetical protein RMI89_04870 [Gloeomargarita sp. SKYBB_i_bin120]|nr:hypothetical protein [Gloeomargarita sp. SKYG98]MCS7292294.1 hypothetical protein [Gloeomargarita sp. SKYB120]MDW8177854.1 hypothetical protein [Gloeomargarita sp. SKYBB_i_bin120]
MARLGLGVLGALALLLAGGPVSATNLYTVVDEFGQSRYLVQPQQILQDQPLPGGTVRFDPHALLIVLINTRRYFREYGDQDVVAQRPGLLGALGISVADVTQTLDFLIEVLLEDLTRGRPLRLQDPAFLRRHLRALSWRAYRPDGGLFPRLRLTQYAVFRQPGCRQPRGAYRHALYQIRDEWVTDAFYRRYTKQEVLAGALAPGRPDAHKVTPLAYLTRAGLEEALLQGTVLVQFPDRTTAYFNVDRHNGLPFVPGVPPWEQQRYWYFREVGAIRGYGHTSESKIEIRPGVTLAGDVWNVGLGRVVLLERGPRQWLLGVIADTGGAFSANLAQLDHLAGVFASRREFFAYNRGWPAYTTVYILVRRKDHDPD